MSYIGNPIVSTDFPVDYKSGDGSTTAFTLSIAPASVNAIDVEVSGVSQSPQTYTLSGTTLTFSAAPPSGTNNIVVKHRGIAGVPNVPSAASVTQTKLASGVAGTGPAFHAYPSAIQTVSALTWTKVTLDIEDFDTNNNFASSTFTPTVAGYYQINGTVWVTSGVSTLLCALYKNGSVYSYSNRTDSSTSQNFAVNVNQVVYCNGSTDYIELYGYTSGTSLSVASSVFTMLSGSLVRAA